MVIDVKRTILSLTSHTLYYVRPSRLPIVCTPVVHARCTLRIVHTYALYEPLFAARSSNTLLHNFRILGLAACELCLGFVVFLFKPETIILVDPKDAIPELLIQAPLNRLCVEVPQHFLRWAIVNFYLFVLDSISNCKISDVNVSSSLSTGRLSILCELDT